MKPRDDSQPDATGLALWYAYALGAFGIGYLLTLLPARALPIVAAETWGMVALAGLGELYARDRSDLLARGRAFAAAGVGLYVVWVAFAGGASGAEALSLGSLARALLFLMFGTTTSDVLSIVNVRVWGRDFFGAASASIRWTMLALAAVSLAEAALAPYLVHSLAGFTR